MLFVVSKHDQNVLIHTNNVLYYNKKIQSQLLYTHNKEK